MRGNMQQKIQPAVSCSQQSTQIDVGEFSDVEAESLPVSHFTDTTAKNEEIQSAAGDCGTVGNSDKTTGSDHPKRHSFAALIAIFFIRIYQKTVSPWIPCCCRFEPSCSHYGLEAFKKRGFVDGLILTTWRVMRCQPFCRGGYDPVPDKGFRRVDCDNHPKCDKK